MFPSKHLIIFIWLALLSYLAWANRNDHSIHLEHNSHLQHPNLQHESIASHQQYEINIPKQNVPSSLSKKSKSNVNPSIQMTVSRDGLNKALEWVVPQVSYLLGLVKIPDYHDSINIPIIGDVQLDVTSMDIKQISIKDLTFQNDGSSQSSFFINLNGLNINMNDNWHYRQNNFPHIEGHGTSEVTIVGASISGKMKMLINDQGKSYIWISTPDDLNVQLGDLSVKVNGGISGEITNALMKIFGKVLKPVITDALKQAVTKEIDDMLKEMTESLSFSIPVPVAENQMNLDITLTDTPNFQDDYASFAIKGAWNIEGKQSPDSPIIPERLPDSPRHNGMLNFFISHAILENFFLTAITGNIFHWHITNDMVPPESPYKLRTDSLKYIFPELYKQYNNSELTLDVDISELPKITLNKDNGFYASLNITLLFSVVQDGGNLKPVFSLSTVFAARSPQLSLINVNEGKSVNVTGTLENADLKILLKDSWIGDINVGYIQTQAKIIIIFGYIPILQQQLKDGIIFDLPEVLYGKLSLLDTLFSFEDGFFDFSSSFKIDPSSIPKIYLPRGAIGVVNHLKSELESENINIPII